MGRSDSESPVRARGPPRKRSSSRRERSPAEHRSSNAQWPSTRNRSPKRASSRSPVSHSPVRGRTSTRTKSPRPRRSISPVSGSPIRQKASSWAQSLKHANSRSSPSLSPVKEKTSYRTRSPNRAMSRSPVSRLPERGKPSSGARSHNPASSRSPESRAHSPRTKRLRRSQADRDAEKGSEREQDKNHGGKGDRATHRERGSDMEMLVERKDRSSGREAVNNGSSRSRHGLSASPPSRHHRSQHRSRSPQAAVTRSRNEVTNSRGADQRSGDDDSIAKMKETEETLEAKEKQKPSFELSGKLAAETNRVKGVTLLFNEPPDARKPDIRWRLYVFKGGEVLNEPLYVHRLSCYLFGRERRVADVPTDHPSCSKQHAVLQYRLVEKENPDGTMSKQVSPYVMDLGSTNGTFVNDSRIEPQRYYELFEKDTIKFGNSSREYVLLHENSTE